MAQRKRRGFTIVELVIVIAVIAILAGVLIPTFISIINKANVSGDTSLVRNINTALAAEDVAGKPATMHEALKLAEANGYTIEKLTPRSSGDIVWDSTSNRFALVNEDGDTVYSYDGKAVAKDATVWKIVASAADAKGNDRYSSYIKGTEATGTIEVSTGVDVGANAGVSEIVLNTSKEQTVVVRTNSSATTLSITAPKATVKHYDAVGTVKVISVDRTASYHEFGKADTLIVNDGHVVVENNATISNVIVEKSTAAGATVSVDNKGEIATVAGADETVTVVGVAEEKKIATVDTLTAEGGYVKLTDDQSINEILALVKDTVLDLNGHKITIANDKYISLYGTLTVIDSSDSKSGVIEKAQNAGAALLIVQHGGVMVLNGGTVTAGSSYYTDKASYKQTIDVYAGGMLTVNGGTIHTKLVGSITGEDYTGAAIGAWGTAIVNVNGGDIRSDKGFALAGNGATGEGGTTITINGGNIIGGGDTAIYNPQYGVLNINGGYIEGKTCVYVKSGSLNVTGGTFKAIGPKAEFKHNGNGCESTGDCIVIESCAYPGGTPMAYIIKNAVMSSANGKLIVGYVYKDSAEIVITSDLAFEIIHVQ